MTVYCSFWLTLLLGVSSKLSLCAELLTAGLNNSSCSLGYLFVLYRNTNGSIGLQPTLGPCWRTRSRWWWPQKWLSLIHLMGTVQMHFPWKSLRTDLKVYWFSFFILNFRCHLLCIAVQYKSSCQHKRVLLVFVKLWKFRGKYWTVVWRCCALWTDYRQYLWRKKHFVHHFFLVAGVMHVVVVYLFQQRGNSRVAIHRGRRQGASVFENRSNHSHVQDVRGWNWWHGFEKWISR